MLEVLISQTLIDLYVSQGEIVLANNILREKKVKNYV